MAHLVRYAIQILAPLTTVAGILLSLWGTYKLTHWYHNFDERGFSGTLWRVIVLAVKGKSALIFREADIATRIASVDAEAKAESLVGVYLIFFGFLLQLIGTIFWGADAIWGIIEKS